MQPITDGGVDPAVLAALPPSIQLDLLVQMRERLMAENRQKYQKVKKAPQKFSELQIEAYLKTVAFRREIDQVQKAASGKGVGDVQTSRIASESNREYIFSSSFSGDKLLLASGGAEKNPVEQQSTEKKDSSFDILNAMVSATKSNSEAGSDVDGTVQTFLDERGRMRVSRRRAMGIRMTSDLQRNIDLLNELEQERTVSTEANARKTLDMEVHPGKSKSLEAPNEFNCSIMQNSEVKSLEPEIPKDTLSETCITISFDDHDGKQNSLDGVDDLFAHLVAGDHVPFSSDDNSTSDIEWEEGTIGRERGSSSDGNKLETNSFYALYENDTGSDVEWEEGTSIMHDKSCIKSLDVEEISGKETVMKWPDQPSDVREHVLSFSADVQKAISKGSAEEEAALQEAVRRSIQDLTDGKASSTCNIEQQLESCSPLPSSHLDRVLDGNLQSQSTFDNQKSQSTIDECDRSNLLTEKNTFESSFSGTHLTSSDLTTAGPVHCIDTKDLHEQQINTSTETNHDSNFESGFVTQTDMATDSLNGTIPKKLTDDKDNDEAIPMSNPNEVYEYFVGQTTSVSAEQTLHGNSKKIEGKDGIYLVGLNEICHDMNFASKDEENTLKPLGSSLEDELLVLDQEFKSLGDEQRKLERNADSANAEMFVECQELLQMFGLPYIIAPMEAEAQCAYMELANLVDGVVTDDSDVFLFGAQSVYKNIFDDRKYVETYLMKDIESELGLNREKLIRMALLLGSDYTEGVSGIGIVNAIEVVNAFPEEDGLQKFREWIESPDPAILGKLGVEQRSSSKKKGSRTSKKGTNNSKNKREGSAADYNPGQEDDDIEARNDVQNNKLSFMNKHRNVSKNWHIPASFPSNAVISAYEAPQVDKSTEPFAWGKPDIFSLRRLCWEKFAWSSQKADELLLPVLKEYNKHETQLRLEAFYSFNERFAKIRSKRIQKAVKGITGKQSLDIDEAGEHENPAKQKTEGRAFGNKRKKSNVGERTNSAKGKQKGGLSTEVRSTGLCTEADKQGLSHAQSSRLKGRRNGTASGRSKQNDSSDSELNDTSTRNYNSSSDEHEHEAIAQSVRRSKRARKPASYFEEEEETDVSTKKCRKEDLETADYIEQDLATEDLLEQSFAGDYLVNGGGFCAEEEQVETESDQMSSIQRDTSSIDANREYLQMGGGFCVDDEDDLGLRKYDEGGASACGEYDEDAYAPITTCPSENVTALPSVPDTTVQGDLYMGDQRKTTDGSLSTLAPTNNKGAPTSVNPFSAIPYLKKKRKR
ncbi:DNA repair protein UVH3 isoform X2 [Amaranthus tricolor]|uniref:DNA repair protein UVH3 isoform X2 n=1 Tax=Amaranthus tricolor TaxID=29722 RepID=UPI002582FD15|nr:DNA repair protein UVH3 isoform X2 [Amaranthus tricolor]